MLPANIIYPEFVPDQLLTSDQLNNFFGYLDEQGRMTRTNLLGIGIVCGLKVVTKADKSSVTITAGCGVTSLGYLISLPEVEYDVALDFDPVQLIYYDLFVDSASKTEKVTLWELSKTAATNQNEIVLKDNVTFLNNKVVLLFVELLEEQNKNCDPNSCDDKGKNITVTTRALLISKNDADKLRSTADAGTINAQSFSLLDEMKMPRFDVLNTNPVTSEDIFKAYQKILTKDFIDSVNGLLSSAYTAVSNWVKPEFQSDPFTAKSGAFAFLYDGTIVKNSLVHMQYYYDYFSDLLQAYDEFRTRGTEILGTCCPDPTLFPRHLLLGEALPLPATQQSQYRTYFIYSPLFHRRNLVDELRSLFTRLVSLEQNFVLPAISDDVKDPSVDSFIRITPSHLGCGSFSEKSIPYYYRPNSGTFPLYLYWNYNKTLLGKADTNLSYNASEYSNLNKSNAAKDWVINPLKYDLEPYNFFRIEGIVGKPVTSVLAVLLDHVTQGISEHGKVSANRLPFEIIAVRTGELDIEAIDFTQTSCNFNDLEISYDIARREYEAVIGLSIEWLNKNRAAAIQFVDTGEDQRLEKFIADMLQPVKKFLVDDLPIFIGSYTAFLRLYEKIENEATSIRDFLVVKFNNGDIRNPGFLEDLIDHFDELIMAAKKGPFRALHQAFTQRFRDVYSAQFFSYYTSKHPGIQHKAGVPVGGTFILVYHENEPTRNAAGKSTSFVSNANLLSRANAATANTSQPSTDIRTLIDEVAALKNRGTNAATLEARVKAFFDTPAGAAKAATATALPDIIKTILNGTVIADFYLPYRCCSDCPPIQYIVNLPPPPVNQPPVAVPQANVPSITIGDGVILELDGSNSVDPENFALKAYSWSTGIGSPACTIVSPSSVSTQVTDLVAGTYEFKLVVTDQEDAISAPASIIIPVNPPENQVPVAVAVSNADTITIGDETVLQLDGTGSSDPEGGELTYAWSLATGSPSCTITDPGSAITTVTDLVPGSYGFILMVTDQQGATSAPVSVVVTVNPAPNQRPIAVASSNVSEIILGGETTQLVLIGEELNDPDGDPITFLWTIANDSPAATIVGNTNSNTEVTDLQPGVYTFSLVVTDDKGASSDPSTVTVTVSSPANEQPVAIASSNTSEITLGDEITLRLDGSDSSDPDGDLLSFQWSTDASSPSCTINDPTGINTTVSNLVAGSYTFVLVVTDTKGSSSDPATVSVTVSNPPNQQPVAVATANTGTITLGSENFLELDGNGSFDPENGPLIFTWTIQPGSPSATIVAPTSATSEVTDLQPGTYVFSLVVTDAQGSEFEPSTVSVQVIANNPPSADAGLNRVIDTGTTSILDGSGSTDPENNIVDFAWKILEPAALSGEAIQNPDQVNATISGLQQGSRYRVSLTVTDAGNLKNQDEVFIWARKNSNLRHQCTDAQLMMGTFNTLLNIDDNLINFFRANFKSFDEVQTFVNQVQQTQIFAQQIAQQVKFFGDYQNQDSATGNTQTLTEAMQDWLPELILIFTSDDDQFTPIRNVALKFYNALVSLAIYISCIQSKDFNQSQIPTDKVLTTAHLQVFTKKIVSIIFNDSDRAEYKALEKLFTDELNRLLTDNLAPAKALYFDFIADMTIFFEQLDSHYQLKKINLIGRQSIEINFHGRADHFALQKQINQWCTDKLMPLIERKLERFSNIDQVYRLQNITVEFTAVKELDDAMAERIAHEVEQVVEAQIFDGNDPAIRNEVKTLHPAEYHFETLTYFLEQGYLPWNSTITSVTEFIELLSKIEATDISAVQRIQLANLLQQSAVLNRVFASGQPQLAATIFALLVPGKTDVVSNLLALVSGFAALIQSPLQAKQYLQSMGLVLVQEFQHGTSMQQVNTVIQEVITLLHRNFQISFHSISNFLEKTAVTPFFVSPAVKEWLKHQTHHEERMLKISIEENNTDLAKMNGMLTSKRTLYTTRMTNQLHTKKWVKKQAMNQFSAMKK